MRGGGERRGSLSLVLVLTLFLVSPCAAASELLTSYDVASGCPTKEQASARLEAHLDGKVPTDAPTFGLKVERAAAVHRGILETTQPSGTKQRRALEDPSCDDVVWSLVFVAALAVSPDAKALPPVPVAAPESPPPSPAGPPANVDPSLGESPRRAPGDQPPASAPPATSQSTLGNAIELGPELRAGPLPSLGYGITARGSIGRGLFALAVSGVRSPDEALDRGSASFWLATLRPHVCPLRTDSLPVRLEACAGIDVGVLHASSSGVDDGRDVTALWIAGELAGRARVDLGQALFVAIEVRGGLPLHRPTYTKNLPRKEVYEVPVITGASALLVGLKW